MPEITPELIRKHFDTLPPERRDLRWKRAVLFAMREFMRSRRDAKLWLEDIIRHSPDLMPLITECVESLILRLDAAGKRIEELDDLKAELEFCKKRITKLELEATRLRVQAVRLSERYINLSDAKAKL